MMSTAGDSEAVTGCILVDLDEAEAAVCRSGDAMAAGMAVTERGSNQEVECDKALDFELEKKKWNQTKSEAMTKSNVALRFFI